MAYSQKAINKYQSNNYYRLSITLPKEHREDIKAAAAARGMSVSRMVCELLGRELGLDLVLDGDFPGAKSKE